MIFTIATAAILSCGEAQNVINRIDSTKLTRRQYIGLVREVKRMAPRRCLLVNTPGLFRGDIRRVQRRHRPVYLRPTFVWRF